MLNVKESKQCIDAAINQLQAAQETLNPILDNAQDVTVMQTLENAHDVGAAILATLLIRTAIDELKIC